MPSSQQFDRIVLRVLLCLVVGHPVLLQSTHGQTTQETDELNMALKRARSGDVDGRDVVVIANAGAVQAIPSLEEQYKRTTDVDTKLSIASGLVQMKDRDDTYWNFLQEQAALAVDSAIPDANFSPSQGKMMDPAPELQVWADAHNISVETAFRYARYDIPGKVLQLATTGDPRGIPLLRRALQSHNFLMASSAARGLAQIQDKQSIPLIIAAVEKAPVGYNAVIAESLVYFDDAQAQGAVDAHVPKDMAKLLREARAHGHKLFGD